MRVELKYAGIPFIGVVAVHYWFVTNDHGKRERWEVWHRANVGGLSMGHLHRNLLPPDAPVGGGPTRLACCWSDADAASVVQALQESWDQYPYRDHYRPVPGPNSNTFVAWILHRASITYPLSCRAIGKNFRFPR
jgi:hypothetical protein